MLFFIETFSKSPSEENEINLALVFLEFYWITFVKILGFQLYTDNPELLVYFNTDSQTNLVDLFKLRWLHLFVFLIGGYISYRIGKWVYLKTLSNIK